MPPLLLLSIICYLPILVALDCKCSRCETGFCTGDYCYIKGNVEGGAQHSGCHTPREDIWKDEKLPLCEKNTVDSTLCLCNSGNFCNVDETFAGIHANGTYAEQNLMECVKKRWIFDPEFPNSDSPPYDCQSSYCATYESRTYNEFRDLIYPPFFQALRQCHVSSEPYDSFRIDLSTTTPQMNSCLHIRWNPEGSELICICNTPTCNENVPMYNITKRGKGICYLKTKETATSTCWGDFCFWTEDSRGCIDAVGADANFKLRLGESTYDNNYLVICQGSYCNSDVLYPNGTIVGPSAERKFSTNLAIEMTLMTLFLSLAAILM